MAACDDTRRPAQGVIHDSLPDLGNGGRVGRSPAERHLCAGAGHRLLALPHQDRLIEVARCAR